VFYSASNAKLKVNDEEILASNASLSLSASLQPNYLITQRSTNKYVASNGVGGTLSFNYYLTGKDYFKSFITGQGEREKETTVISGNFGGLNFDSGYLTSYSVNFGPNAPASASATVTFFDELQGDFTSVEELAPDISTVLNFRNAVVSNVGQVFESGSVENFVGGAYNYTAEVKPVYLINETKPSSVSFGPKNVNLNFEIDTPSGYLPYSGASAKISVDLKNNQNNVVENFTCDGALQQRDIGSSVGDYIKQTINIIQGSTDASKVVVDAGGFIGL
jgi:hypothetical protein|tara:strand:- start:300 stop:1130 length:831 start_codon:yes stop_codon:yes gene_type:complete